jgi:hypothetical protein
MSGEEMEEALFTIAQYVLPELQHSYPDRIIDRLKDLMQHYDPSGLQSKCLFPFDGLHKN